jgi:hypothetical protein
MNPVSRLGVRGSPWLCVAREAGPGHELDLVGGENWGSLRDERRDDTL